MEKCLASRKWCFPIPSESGSVEIVWAFLPVKWSVCVGDFASLFPSLVPLAFEQWSLKMTLNHDPVILRFKDKTPNGKKAF